MDILTRLSFQRSSLIAIANEHQAALRVLACELIKCLQRQLRPLFIVQAANHRYR